MLGGHASVYDQYSAVYFLNIPALKMCIEIGLNLPIIDETTTEQMSQYGTHIHAEYLPIAAR